MLLSVAQGVKNTVVEKLQEKKHSKGQITVEQMRSRSLRLLENNRAPPKELAMIKAAASRSKHIFGHWLSQAQTFQHLIFCFKPKAPAAAPEQPARFCLLVLFLDVNEEAQRGKTATRRA